MQTTQDVEETKTLQGWVSEHNLVTMMLNESGGEFTPEIEATLMTLDVALPAKVDGYHFRMKKLESEIEFLKDREKFYSRIRKAYERAHDWMKSNIKIAMERMQVKELAGNEVIFKTKRTKPKLVIDDPSLVPSEFKIAVTTYEIDNDKIRAALETDRTIAWARLEESSSLTPYPNTGRSS